MSKPLAGKVCLVTGASRGNGRGIALQLGEAGATVYITGRTLKTSQSGQPGSLEDTAAEIESRGGTCIPVQCDHGVDAEVQALFERIKQEQNGQLDVLVNNVYAAVSRNSQTCGQPFWEHEEDMWDHVNGVGLRNHYKCTVYAAQMMVPRKQGLIVNISSFGGLRYFLNVPYGVGKAAVDRMAADCAVELKPHGVTMVCLWPGPARTETFQKFFGEEETALSTDKSNGQITGTEDNEHVNLVDEVKDTENGDISKNRPKEDVQKTEQKPFNDNYEQWKRLFAHMESVEFPGKCIVKLATDPKVIKKTGRILLTADLGDEYNLQDINGKKAPNHRSAKLRLQNLGHPKAASVVPSFVKIPHWMLARMSNKF